MNEDAMHEVSPVQKKCRVLRNVALLAEIVSLAALAAACAAGDPAPSPHESSANARAALAGVDGARTVSAAGTVVNAYTTLAANAAANATSIQVASVSALALGADALAPGDLLLVIQMQGATIQTTEGPNWGQVTALNGAGLYEFVEVLSVDAGTNTIGLSCALTNAYVVAGSVQVIRVPQFETLTIAPGASIVAPAWNGTVGGVAAVHARTTLTLNGDIDVSARGFRGGPADNSSEPAGTDVAVYASVSASAGARKGEGIAGLLTQYGRAPAANGGGGGNSHNGGGGGGANARSGAAWTGQGVFDLTVKGGAQAWPIDPNYSSIASEGGGRGGYSYSSEDENALTLAPDKAAWGGNSRRQRGGFGGRPLDNDPASRIFMGGGGGAGDGNNSHAGRGGVGGGIVLVLAGSVTGTGRILANGENGVSSDSVATPPDNGDAPGGGGGGGTVIVRAATATGFSVQARGGNGGNQTIDNGDEAEGPGGGGGGGFVAISSTVTADVSGGSGGVTDASAVAEFPSNGATAGSSGKASFAPPSLANVPYCADTTAPNTSITTSPPNPTNDNTGTFVFASNDAMAGFECRIDSAAFASCNQTYTTSALPDGTHTLQVRARDRVGNVDPSPASVTWVIDTAAPNTSITTRPETPTGDTTGTFVFDSNETNVDYECRVDSAAFGPCLETFTTVALTDGQHTLQVRAVDAAGNVDPTPASATWVIDTTPPDTTIDSRPDDPTSDATGDFTFSATEAGSTFQCSLDDSAWAVCSSPFETDALATGSHTFRVRATDAAGNVDPTPATYTWTVVLAGDSDNDGLTDDEEVDIGTDPQDADSDDDGLPDGGETNPGTDTDDDGLVNALDPDSDNDGVFDGTESGVTTAPVGTDETRGRFVPDADPSETTDPLDADTDDGGLSDGAEDPNHDGAVDTGERDPNDPSDDTDAPDDTDGDGLTDDEEEDLGTDPDDADSDDDGLPDGLEPNPADDHDGDGSINPLDPDSDDDGVFDGTEAGRDCAGPGVDTDAEQCIPDGDQGDTTTGVLDPDTDDGGVNDGDEDADKDGVVDSGERDPLNPSDDDSSPPGEGGAGGGGPGGAGGENLGGEGPGGEGLGGEGGTGGSSGAAATGGGGTAGASGGTAGRAGSGGAGANAGAPDDEQAVILGGGICAYRPPNTASGFLAFFAVALAALGRRRQRR